MDPVPNTGISDVDGERNRIVIRGWNLKDLAGSKTYEEMCGLLWTGKPAPIPLGEARVQAARHLGGGGDLRSAIGSLATDDPIVLTAAMAVAVRRGEPDPAASHASDYLRMITGRRADPARAKALDTYFVTMAENGLNTSTYVSRIVASTGAHAPSAIVAALCALEGPLHGGAPDDVLEMFHAVGSAGRSKAWVEAELAAGRRIPGMGHRIFKGRDPRAAILERAAAELAPASRLDVARAVERAATEALAARGKPLQANVEFYTAVLLDAVGIPAELFTTTFAVARVAGWCAHIAEQRAEGKLIQPNARYIGPPCSDPGAGL